MDQTSLVARSGDSPADPAAPETLNAESPAQPEGTRDFWAEAVELAGVPESRKTSLFVHSTLRDVILSGRLKPGTTLSQARLAQILKVSRTPMREALRMLQEEGLIDAEPNRRPRVRGVDPGEIDSLYAARILLESLAMSLSAPGLGGADVATGDELLRRMEQQAADEDFDAWHRTHLEFHQLLVSGVDDYLRSLIGSLAEKGQRFVRIYQISHPATGWTVGAEEHAAILDAVRQQQPDIAVTRLIKHLARTALSVLLDVAPDRDASAVRGALTLVTQMTPDKAAAPTARAARR
jgi:DNA-binding GntR family transcriptional regulator